MNADNLALLKAQVRSRLAPDATGRITYSARANAIKGRVPASLLRACNLFVARASRPRASGYSRTYAGRKPSPPHKDSSALRISGLQLPES